MLSRNFFFYVSIPTYSVIANSKVGNTNCRAFPNLPLHDHSNRYTYFVYFSNFKSLIVCLKTKRSINYCFERKNISLDLSFFLAENKTRTSTEVVVRKQK